MKEDQRPAIHGWGVRRGAGVTIRHHVLPSSAVRQHIPHVYIETSVGSSWAAETGLSRTLTLQLQQRAPSLSHVRAAID
jgi:hypothetical protein